MKEVTDWTLLRSFLAVVRHGSLSGAARALKQTQPTIGRHIDELETGLGVALFTRSQSGLHATRSAFSLVPHAEAMETAFGALVRSAKTSGDREQPQGVVRISASESMGTFALPPALASIRHRFPDISIELALNSRLDDLLRRDADIAVRMARPKQKALVARKVGTITLGLYAHRQYVERFGLPRGIEDVKQFHLIGFDRDNHSARSVLPSNPPVSREDFSLRVDSDVAQVMAVRAGIGIGIMQKRIAVADPQLVPVLPHAIAPVMECWLALHRNQKSTPAIRAVFDGLADGLAEWTD